MVKKFFLLLLYILISIFIFDSVYASNIYGSSGYKSGAVYPSSIIIKSNSNNIFILGKEYKLNVEFTPSNATERNIIWSVDRPDILSIKDNGVIVAKKTGQAIVTAKTVNGLAYSIVINVRNQYSTSGTSKNSKKIYISNAPKQMLTGDKILLNVKSSVDLSDLEFKSSNEKVLKVNKFGEVTAVGNGSATIIVTANKETVKTTIEVKDYIIKLSESKIEGEEGDSKEITATIKTNKKIDDNQIHWSSTSSTSVSVKPQENNVYKAIISLKKSGSSNVKLEIGSSSASTLVKVLKVNSDYSIECPIMTYDKTNANNIKILIDPNSSIDHYDIYVSSNKKTGLLALWQPYTKGLKSKQYIYVPYSYAQAKLVVFNKNGHSRLCYTAPFDLDGHMGSKTKVTYTNNIKCPVIKDSILEKVKGAKQYSMHFYGGNDVVTTGVRLASFDLKANPKSVYQYTWLTNVGNDCVSKISNSENCSWKTFKTFDQYKTVKFTLTMLDETYHNRQGMFLAMDSSGNVQACYTNVYNSLNYDYKEKINGTDVYFEKNYPKDRAKTINFLKKLPKHYFAASSISFYNKDTFDKVYKDGACGVAYTTSLRVFINGVCDSDFTNLAIVHEIGHNVDNMYGKLSNNVRLSNKNDFKTLFNTYDKRIISNNHIYLREYAYTNTAEFWAELFSESYLNTASSFEGNKYRNKWKTDNNLDNVLKQYLSDYLNLYEKKKSDLDKYKKQYQ